MIYSNLLDNVPAILGLGFTGVWLIYKAMLIAYKLDIVREVRNWFNHRPIIIPSLFFISSPFILTFMSKSFFNNSDDLIKAFTPITCIAAYIAYQQYQVNRQQLRKNLSDKRFQVYVSTMTLVAVAIKNIPELIKEKCINFEPHFYESQFLFGADVNKKLEEIYSKAYDLMSYKENIKELNDYGTKQSQENPDWYNDEKGESDKNQNIQDLKYNCKKSKEIREWFEKEKDAIKSLFHPYIDLSSIAIERDKNYC
ncbi:hypothetical protein WA1_41020 [Scytonema hofmannii PCC 7110]|uniref:Uncharacterized protein n=1 Tax=Scytonema hofmannii PCC 7110 TaxID=128403 RepID=A0A139WUM0_9CYAN|nr:hypothetical protein [Scytonema hofmannii]KYC36124.1 hypothetical protein WA1_41020 [Scytonema hofmannii PCC 7110]